MANVVDGLKIDSWTHVLPGPFLDRLGSISATSVVGLQRLFTSIPALYDLNARFRMMDRFPGCVQVIAPVPIDHILPELDDQTVVLDLARLANDGMASLVARYPERFVGFAATIPLANPDLALVELDRAILQLGALGVQIQTDVNGLPLDDSRFEPFWARMAGLGRAVWIHPYRPSLRPDYPAEEISKYGLWQIFGWPFDTTLAMSRLVFSGILERYPTLKVIAHHGGGMVPHFAGRIGDMAEYLGAHGLDETLAAALSSLRQRPIEYFRMFYVDTALFGAGNAVACVVDFFGSDHVLFGTDAPFGPEEGSRFIRDTIANVDALPIEEATRRSIYEGNARRVLGLDTT